MSPMNNLVQMPAKTPEKIKKRNININDAGDVKRLLNSIINDLRNGEIDSKSANAIGYLANIMLKAVEISDMEGRLKTLETEIAKLS